MSPAEIKVYIEITYSGGCDECDAVLPPEGVTFVEWYKERLMELEQDSYDSAAVAEQVEAHNAMFHRAPSSSREAGR